MLSIILFKDVMNSLTDQYGRIALYLATTA